MYDSFDAQKALVPEGHFCEVKYEHLVGDPLGEVKRIYRELGLGDFDTVRPRLTAYLEGLKDYQTNRHVLPEETAAKIEQRWSTYMTQYGYGNQTA